MEFEELEEMCQSVIETHLLHALYPVLMPAVQKELTSQYRIGIHDERVTVPDFTFPHLRIAIYCDGYVFHSDLKKFKKDRQQSRWLQLRGWYVLRFAGAEILDDTDAVVRTILKAVDKRLRRQAARRRLIRYRYGNLLPNSWRWVVPGGIFVILLIIMALHHFAPISCPCFLHGFMYHTP